MKFVILEAVFGRVDADVVFFEEGFVRYADRIAFTCMGADLTFRDLD